VQKLQTCLFNRNIIFMVNNIRLLMVRSRPRCPTKLTMSSSMSSSMRGMAHSHRTRGMSSTVDSTTETTTETGTTQQIATTLKTRDRKLFMPSSYYTDLKRIDNQNLKQSNSPFGREKRFNNSMQSATRQPDYVLYISALRNNTHVHLSLASTGATIAQTTAGMLGLKKAARGT
jgi:hypothetical protein